jgi:hypothetical protein
VEPENGISAAHQGNPIGALPVSSCKSEAKLRSACTGSHDRHTYNLKLRLKMSLPCRMQSTQGIVYSSAVESHGEIDQRLGFLGKNEMFIKTFRDSPRHNIPKVPSICLSTGQVGVSRIL